jgi:nucleoid DNA-binding protein
VNKTQLINQVARKAHCSKSAAKKCVDACFASIKKGTKKGSGCSISGFGRFWYNQSTSSRTRNGRSTGRTWRKGQGTKTVCFKPTKRW